MKKLLYVLFILSLSLSFVACGGDKEEDENKNGTTLKVTVLQNGIPQENAIVRVFDFHIYRPAYQYIGKGNILYTTGGTTINVDENVVIGKTDKNGIYLFENATGEKYSFGIDLKDQYTYRELIVHNQDSIIVDFN